MRDICEGLLKPLLQLELPLISNAQRRKNVAVPFLIYEREFPDGSVE